MIREQISKELKEAMLHKDAAKLSAVRLIVAKLRELDINARPSGNMNGISEPEILNMMQSMIKQRKESIELYKQGNRQDLVDKEQGEIDVILTFMPKQFSEDDMIAAIKTVVAKIGAKEMKDMGKVMAELKTTYSGQMDFAKASDMVKKVLQGQ